MILDDGGDLTQLMHQKYPELLARCARAFGGNHDRRASALRHGTRRHAAGAGDQRQRLRHQVEVRQPLWLPRVAWSTASAAATDVMMAGKVAVVAGFGDVGKGSAASLRNAGAAWS